MYNKITPINERIQYYLGRHRRRDVFEDVAGVVAPGHADDREDGEEGRRAVVNERRSRSGGSH